MNYPAICNEEKMALRYKMTIISKDYATVMKFTYEISIIVHQSSQFPGKR
jgi:hypothetical protein